MDSRDEYVPNSIEPFFGQLVIRYRNNLLNHFVVLSAFTNREETNFRCKMFVISYLLFSTWLQCVESMWITLNMINLNFYNIRRGYSCFFV